MNSKHEKQLRQVLKKFRNGAFYDTALPILSPWVPRKNLVSRLRASKSKLNLPSVVNVFIDLLKKSSITKEDLEEKLPSILLLEVALNAEQRTWTAYTLKGNADAVKHTDELETDIRHFFLENNCDGTVTVQILENRQWVRIVPKKLLKKRMIFYAPVYVAYFPGEPYMFLSSKAASDGILKSLSEGFGHNGYKYSNLAGHDLESMVKHLNQKGVRRGYAEQQSFNNHQDIPNGKDFSQHETRRKFISDLMGQDPPKLANYVVEAKNLSWNGKMNFPEMQDCKFDMKIEFKTNDTVEMLKDMAECGVLKVPPPTYVNSLLSTGRNNIKLKMVGRARATDTETQTDG